MLHEWKEDDTLIHKATLVRLSSCPEYTRRIWTSWTGNVYLKFRLVLMKYFFQLSLEADHYLQSTTNQCVNSDTQHPGGNLVNVISIGSSNTTIFVSNGFHINSKSNQIVSFEPDQLRSNRRMPHSSIREIQSLLLMYIIYIDILMGSEIYDWEEKNVEFAAEGYQCTLCIPEVSSSIALAPGDSFPRGGYIYSCDGRVLVIGSLVLLSCSFGVLAMSPVGRL